MRKVFITNNFEETQKIAQKFVKELKGGDILALYGDLGSGKTTFVQGIAKGLGIQKRIISPTFIIIRKYELRIKNYELGIRNFYHIDLYRIDSQRDIEGLGMDEIMSEHSNIVAIEWVEKMGKLLPRKRIDIKFEYLDEDKRKITIKKLFHC